MRVLSLFDGMSCGQIALRDMGIVPEVYYVSEVDKFAIAQTQLNFPNTIQLGDVRQLDVNQLIGGGKIDLLIGGSPCQSFSFAGKRVGMSTKDNEKILTLERYLELKEQGFEFEGQSYLFWEYMRILKDLQRINPNVKFLLENVKMKKEWERVLTEAIGVEGVHINSALVSAQNRKRIYWTNIGQVEQPEDRGLLLKDILEENVSEKYFLKEEVWRNLMKRNELQDKIGGHFYVKPMSSNKKSNAVLVKGKWKDDLVEDPICVAMRGRPQGEKNAQQLEPSPNEDKSNCLTTVAKDNLILQRSRGFNKGNVFAEKSPTLSSNAWEQNNLLLTPKPRIRRLTPTECARLQTVPDWYKWQCSETQQYKMLGNGWTIEVIKHIFSYL